jgi:hypothetical protein
VGIPGLDLSEWKPLGAGGQPIDPSKLPKQEAFLYDMAHRFQAYGGGLGNGKTTAACLKAFYLSYLFPGNAGFIGRLDGKELRQTTMAEFIRLVPDKFFDKKNDQLGYRRFKPQYGGSEIFYGDLKEDRFNNINLGWFFIDQAEEIDVIRFELLVSRLRRQTPLIGDDGQPIKVNGVPLTAPTYGFVTFNPEGTNSYIWRYFHPDSPERVCTCETSSACKVHQFQLYQASTYDGLAAGFIPRDYVDGMLSVFPPDARKRYLDGSWDVFSGRIFPQFSMEDHVIDYIKAEPHWKIYESIDHGIKNPTAVGWWGVDEFGNRFLLDEHYEGDGKPVKYHAEVIKAKRAQFKQPIALTYLDSACWATNQTRGDNVYSTVDEYNSYDIFPIKGQKDWDSGYSRICDGLRIDPSHVNPFTGEQGSPHIFVASHCTNFIKEAIGYRWKKNRITTQMRNEPDEPMDRDDHHMDEWFYFEASRPTAPIIARQKKIDPLATIRERHRLFNPLADTAVSGTWMSR